MKLEPYKCYVKSQKGKIITIIQTSPNTVPSFRKFINFEAINLRDRCLGETFSGVTLQDTEDEYIEVPADTFHKMKHLYTMYITSLKTYKEQLNLEISK